MDIRDKIVKAFSRSFPVDYVRLEDDDGITGFVVSSKFQNMSSFDRQKLMDDVLRDSSAALSNEERRKVLMIAGLTPAEYDTVGARVRVHKVEELADHTIEVLVHGGHSDAEYVRGALKGVKGVRTTEPEAVPGAIGVLMSFQATGKQSDPLTKSKVIRALKKDGYIQVMPNA